MSATGDIKAALRRRYAAPEWAIMFEVGDATGARHTRFADAVAMSLWPSRGLTLHGFEIKISRSDWKKERAQPEKAETIAAYCDYWTLVTAKNVVLDADEIPPAWGWLEWDGTKFNRRRDDTRTDAKAIERQFLAALLRRADKSDEERIDAEVRRRTAASDGLFEQRVQEAAVRRAGQVNDASRQIEAFEKASGIKLEHWHGDHSPEAVGRAVKVVLGSRIEAPYSGLLSLVDSIKTAADTIERSVFDFGFDPQPKTRGKR